jgi:hypothetical protein
MDWIDPFWPDDLSQVQWGPVSTWVGSILTAGSLAVAFSILLRDRRKAESEQARDIQCWVRFEESDVPNGRHSYVVTIHNYSGKQILAPRVEVVEADTKAERRFTGQPTIIPMRQGTTELVQGPLMPDAVAIVPFASAYSKEELGLRVIYRDAKGLVWEQDIMNGGLRRYREERKF